METLLATLPAWSTALLKGSAAVTVLLYLIGLFAKSNAYGRVRTAWGRIMRRAGQVVSAVGNTRLGRLWQPLERILVDFGGFGSEQFFVGLRDDDPEKMDAQVARLRAVGSVTRAMALAVKADQLRKNSKPADPIEQAIERSGRDSIGRKLGAFALALAVLFPVAAHSQPALDKLRFAATLDAEGDSLLIAGNGYGTVGFQLSGTWSGTVKFTASIDASTWVAVFAFNVTTKASDSVATDNGIYLLPTTGYRYIKARMDAYTSGEATLNSITSDDVGILALGGGSGGGGGVGTEVDVLSIAAGNNNIGNVDVVTSALPTGAATAANQSTGNGHLSTLAGAVKAEDAAHTTGDVGVQALAVRSDADVSLAGATGDYTPLQVDDNGFLKVNIKAGAGSGGTASTDDAAFTPASGSGTPIMGLADETTPDAVDEGDAGVVRMTLNRALHVNLRDASGNELSVGAQYAEDAAHSSGDQVMMAGAVRRDSPASSAGADGDNATLNTDADGRLYTNNKGTGATGAAVPAAAQYMGAVSSGNLTGIIQADASAIINMSTATTTQIVALTSAQKIYITAWDVIAAGTGTIKLVYGTGTNCGTGTTDLTPAYSLVAQAGIAKGAGLGPVLVVPAGNALCATTSAAVGMQGTVSYTKF